LQSTEKELEATTDPFIGSIETATTPSSASFETYSGFQRHFQEVEQQQVVARSDLQEQEQEEVEYKSFQQKKVFWESKTSGDSSPTESEKEAYAKITPHRKEHFETFVKPSLDDTNTEAEDLEFKAIPSEKLETPIDQDRMITRQIKDGIVDMELEEGDEPVMMDSWIDKRSPTPSAPQPEPEEKVEPQEEPREAAPVVKRAGIKFLDEEEREDKPEQGEAQRAAERLVESIKMKAVLIAEEIRRSPYEQVPML
jgi:hypothetical protein